MEHLKITKINLKQIFDITNIKQWLVHSIAYHNGNSMFSELFLALSGIFFLSKRKEWWYIN